MTLKVFEGKPVLAEVRCKAQGCGRLLDRVVSAPVTDEVWAGWVPVHLCPRHGAGAGHGSILAWQGRQLRAGKPADRVQNGKWIPWADLRPAVEKARRTGRTQAYSA